MENKIFLITIVHYFFQPTLDVLYPSNQFIFDSKVCIRYCQHWIPLRFQQTNCKHIHTSCFHPASRKIVIILHQNSHPKTKNVTTNSTTSKQKHPLNQLLWIISNFFQRHRITLFIQITFSICKHTMKKRKRKFPVNYLIKIPFLCLRCFVNTIPPLNSSTYPAQLTPSVPFLWF